MDCNANVLDSIYTPINCVTHITRVGQMVRDNRKIFLHKGAMHRLRGYSYSQLHKVDLVKKDKHVQAIRNFEDEFGVSHTTLPTQIDNLELKEEQKQQYRILFENGMNKTKRFISQKTHNTDIKFLYHVARLLDECEQILTIGDMDIQRSKEYLKAIRRGDVKEDEVRAFFSAKEKVLDKYYHESTLPYGPNEELIKELLLQCLEEHYGNLSACIVKPDAYLKCLRDIKERIEKELI